VVLEGHAEIFHVVRKPDELHAVNGHATRSPKATREVDEHPGLDGMPEHFSRQNDEIAAAQIEALLHFEQ